VILVTMSFGWFLDRHLDQFHRLMTLVEPWKTCSPGCRESDSLIGVGYGIL
jgi:hypothetical protein